MTTSANTDAPLSEAAYLKQIAEAQAQIWPKGISRTPHYPFGEVALSEYLKRWAGDADRVLYNYYGRRITYAEIDRQSDRCAAMLQANGIGKGDSVALFLGSCPQFAIAFFGILKAGAIHVPVNPMFKEHELLYELNDTAAKVVIADHALIPLVRKVQEQCSISKIFGTGLAEMLPEVADFHVPEAVAAATPASDADDFLQALDKAGAPVLAEPDLDAVAALNYTGGTTGMPKGCVHTQRDMIYTAATACQTNLPLAPGDTCLNFYPLFWIAGEDVGMVLPVFAGATCVLLARWDALSFLTAVESAKVNRAILLVDNAVEVMDHPDVASHDLTGIDTTGVSSFVKKLNLDYRARWQALTGSTMVELSYGMTETHTCDSFTRGLQTDDWDLTLQPILCGLPVPGTEFKITDFDTHALLPIGQEGEICIRSPSNLKSYWNKPDATAEAIRDGWLHTGDIGIIDQHGLLHFLGRRKEMLKVKGMSVFPAEIEALLGRHPGVIGSGVIGRPDDAFGQIPVAFVCLDPEKGKSLTENDIFDWCKDAMATYKRPEIRIVDALPMTATGKVKKGELEKML